MGCVAAAPSCTPGSACLALCPSMAIAANQEARGSSQDMADIRGLSCHGSRAGITRGTGLGISRKSRLLGILAPNLSRCWTRRQKQEASESIAPTQRTGGSLPPGISPRLQAGWSMIHPRCWDHDAYYQDGETEAEWALSSSLVRKGEEPRSPSSPVPGSSNWGIPSRAPKGARHPNTSPLRPNHGLSLAFISGDRTQAS